MSLEDFFESSTSEQAALREEAAANVVNIDAEERAFRTRIGVGLTALTIAVAAFMVISDVTGMSRAPIFVLVWLSVGTRRTHVPTSMFWRSPLIDCTIMFANLRWLDNRLKRVT